MNEVGKRWLLFKQQMFIFGKLTGLVLISVMTLMFLLDWISRRSSHGFWLILFEILYFALAFSFGYYFPKTARIIFVVLLMTFFMLISLIHYNTFGRIGFIMSFFVTIFNIPIAISGCFFGKYFYNKKKMNSPRLNTK